MDFIKPYNNGLPPTNHLNWTTQNIAQQPRATYFSHQTIHNDPLPPREFSHQPTTTNHHRQTICNNPLLLRKMLKIPTITHHHHPIIHRDSTPSVPNTKQSIPNLKTTQNHLLTPSKYPKQPTGTQEILKTTQNHSLHSSNHPNRPEISYNHL